MGKAQAPQQTIPSPLRHRPLVGSARQAGTAWAEFLVVGTFVRNGTRRKMVRSTRILNMSPTRTRKKTAR